jgi:cationic amino acid transporter 14
MSKEVMSSFRESLLRGKLHLFLSCRLLQYLYPKLLPWKEPGPCTEETGRLVTKLVGLLFLQIIVFDLLLVACVGSTGFWASLGTFLLVLLFFGIVGCLLIISRKPQNK